MYQTAKKIEKNFNRLSRANERCRQTTDGQATSYSEREGEFTIANKTTIDIIGK